MIAATSGLKVWTSTLPARSPRPVRPATWVTIWKVRSAARKSGRWSAVSASTTPTKVTLGKSSPLAIIWVPSKIRTSPCLNAASTFSWLPCPRIVSESIRRIDSSGNAIRTSRSSRSVPIPP